MSIKGYYFQFFCISSKIFPVYAIYCNDPLSPSDSIKHNHCTIAVIKLKYLNPAKMSFAIINIRLQYMQMQQNE